MELETMATALGLQRFGPPDADAQLFQTFHDVMVQEFRRHEIRPTYIGISGEGFRGKYTKFNGKTHRRMLSTDFVGVKLLGFAATPEGSDAPAFDAFANCSIGYIDSMEELLFCFVANQSFVSFPSAAFDATWKAFAGLAEWDFGYGFESSVASRPKLHILACGTGELTPDEEAILDAWYAAEPPDCQERLRDVYPYNFVRARQLDRVMKDGTTLREFIRSCDGSTLKQVTDYGLHLWKIEADAIPAAQSALIEQGVVIR